MTKPINPADYVPSGQVSKVIETYLAMRFQGWGEESRINRGARYGVAMILRQLVELETNITDPDDLDELCADLINDAETDRC